VKMQLYTYYCHEDPEELGCRVQVGVCRMFDKMWGLGVCGSLVYFCTWQYSEVRRGSSWDRSALSTSSRYCA